MMVYFQQHKLVYGCDMIQQQQDDSFFMLKYLLELAEAVTREKLTVERVFAMHAGVMNWSVIKAAIEGVTNPLTLPPHDFRMARRGTPSA